MKSIKSKILISIVALVSIALLTVGVLASVLTYQSAQNTLKQTMNELVIIAANNIENSLSGYKDLVMELANNAELTNTNRFLKNKQSTMDSVARRTVFNRITVVTADGEDYEKRDWTASEEFTYCKETLQPYISDPYLNSDGVFLINMSAPILVNGNFYGIIVCESNADFLSETVGNIKVAEGGTAQIFRSDGAVIAHTNYEFAKSLTKYDELAQHDSQYKSIANIMDNILSGEVGFDTYTKKHGKALIVYAPIPETNHWTIAVSAPQKDFISYTIFAIVLTLCVSLVAIGIAFFLAARLAKTISKPIILCAESMDELAKGNLSMETIHTESQDETGVLVNAFNITVENFKSIISDVSENLSQMAQGNMAIEIEGNYEGDFASIKTSMEKIVASLNQALSKIQIASDQVSSGASQVSNGAQALSQGATEQASAIEGLSDTILNISDKVRHTAHNATQANENVASAMSEITHSDDMMREMLSAMSEISSKSSQISKIIKTIDDIAFQTNILALNAAVEAARAGQSGKGFAIVADEVRNLASKSADAAKNTTKLIEGTLAAVKNGTRIANNTASSLTEAVDAAQSIEDIVQEIAKATDEEAAAIVQITQSVDQISAVVQTNSATAEESAAASEELSGQAQMLKDLTKTFILKSVDSAATAYDDGLFTEIQDCLDGQTKEALGGSLEFPVEFTEDGDDKYAVDKTDSAETSEEAEMEQDFDEIDLFDLKELDGILGDADESLKAEGDNSQES